MGKPVTVDSDDLECLLNAAALAVQFERLIGGYQQDPAVMRLKGKMEAALDRVNRARGEALRVVDDPVYDEPLSADAVKALGQIWGSPAEFISALALPDGVITELRRKRMVIMGQCNSVINWGDKTVTGVGEPFQAIKLAERGLEYCLTNFGEERRGKVIKTLWLADETVPGQLAEPRQLT